MKILVVGDPHGVLPKKIPKNVDLILIMGDLPKSDLARKIYLGRKKEEINLSKKDSLLWKKMHDEISSSSLNVAKSFSSIGPVYSLLGNVGTTTDLKIKIEEKKLGIKLTYIREELEKIKNFHLVRNGVKNIGGLRIGFLDYFLDECWIKEFEGNYRGRENRGKKETANVKKILERFGNVDILVSHLPPYGVLDKVNSKFVPKYWKGKHAGSKVVLDYIKKKQPRYVFCGHIHEGKGNAKIGKTEICNVGSEGDYILKDID